MPRLAQFGNRWWLGGVALAAGGVFLARLAAPALAPAAQPWVRLAGELAGLGGLGLIAWGVSRRAHAVPPD